MRRLFTWSLGVGSIGKIRVRLHWTLLFVAPALALLLLSRAASALVLGLVTVGMPVSVLVHELGHAATARRAGVEVSEVLLHALGGVTSFASAPTTPRAALSIAMAGPLCSLGLAGLLGALGAFFPPFLSLALANLVWGLVNVIPAWPLDGGQAFVAFVRIRGIDPVRANHFALQATRLACALMIASACVFGTWGAAVLASGCWYAAHRHLAGRRRPPLAPGSILRALRGAWASRRGLVRALKTSRLPILLLCAGMFVVPCEAAARPVLSSIPPACMTPAEDESLRDPQVGVSLPNSDPLVEADIPSSHLAPTALVVAPHSSRSGFEAAFGVFLVGAIFGMVVSRRNTKASRSSRERMVNLSALQSSTRRTAIPVRPRRAIPTTQRLVPVGPAILTENPAGADPEIEVGDMEILVDFEEAGARESYRSLLSAAIDLNDPSPAVQRHIDRWVDRLEHASRMQEVAGTWRSAVRSHVGPVRSENQDAALCIQVGDLELMVVCDGCGGIPEGRAAAKVAALSTGAYLAATLAGPSFVVARIEDHVRAAFSHAANALDECRIDMKVEETWEVLRTTMIIVVASRDQVVVGYLGDGGAVLVCAQSGAQIDLVDPMKAAGASNVLTGSVGPSLDGEPVVRSLGVEAGDFLFVGTDGVFDRVLPTVFKDLVRRAFLADGDFRRTIELKLCEFARIHEVRLADGTPAFLLKEQIKTFEEPLTDLGPVFDDNMTLGVMVPGCAKPSLGRLFWRDPGSQDGGTS